MSEQGNGILSPDGQHRWDGSAWVPVVAVAPEPTWSAATSGSTVMPAHAMAKQARSFSVSPQQIWVVVVALVVVLVGVVVLSGGHKSTGSPASPSASASDSAPVQAKAAALVACSKMATLIPNAPDRPGTMTNAARDIARAATLDPASTVILTLAGNMTAWLRASTAFDAAIAADEVDIAAQAWGQSRIDLGRSDDALNAENAAWNALSVGCVSLGGASLPA